MKRRPFAWLVLRTLYALIGYDVIHVLLKRRKFHQEIGVKPIATGEEASAECERAMCEAVALATCLLEAGALSVPRAAAAVEGVAARLVIGFSAAPFLSHAWVEVNGRVVNDSPAYQKRLRVLLTA